MVRGQSNKVIAFDLGLSTRTIEAYRAQLLEKLGVKTSAEAIRLAVLGGLNPPR
jgi:two-component system response regulator FixJ